MKNWIFVFVLISSLAHSAALDMRYQQRNATDTGDVNRLVPFPAGGANGLFWYNGATTLPSVVTLGANLSIASGVLSAATIQADWAALSGPSEILNKPSFSTVAFTGQFADLIGSPTNLNAFTNGPGYVSQSGARSAISLTTTGTSGAATYNNSTGVFNIPNYAVTSGTVTSITAGTGLSGGVITTSGTISLPNTGTAGTYNGSVTTDAQGRVTAGTSLTINNSPGRSIVTATNATGFKISSTRVADVCYEGTFSTTSTIGGPAAITVFLETADTNSTTPSDWTIIARQTNSSTITLAIVLQSVDVEPWSLCRKIPAGKYMRIRSGSITGTASATINTEQQETLF